MSMKNPGAGERQGFGFALQGGTEIHNAKTSIDCQPKSRAYQARVLERRFRASPAVVALLSECAFGPLDSNWTSLSDATAAAIGSIADGSKEGRR